MSFVLKIVNKESWPAVKVTSGTPALAAFFNVDSGTATSPESTSALQNAPP